MYLAKDGIHDMQRILSTQLKKKEYASNFNRHFTKDIHMIKNTRKYLTSLIMREIQIETIREITTHLPDA